MRNLFAVICLGVIVAACGPASEVPKSSGEKVYEATANAILVLDSKDHVVSRSLPLGAPSPDWRHLYSILGDSLIDTNPLTAVTQNTLRVGAGYGLPLATNTGLPGGLSPAARWLVLQRHESAATHMLLIDTRTLKVADAIDLAGRFNFDAVSEDGLRLYLIQYLNGKEYFVRLFNIPTNSLDDNIVVDKSDGNQAMAGVRLSGIATPDGSSLFSLYVRERESPFVHALSLMGPFAFCLDLPGGGYARWSLAMNRAGDRVYAVGGADGVVAVVDSNQMQVLRSVPVRAGLDVAVLSSDGSMLLAGGTSGLAWIDTSSLSVQKTSLTEWHVSSLALSPDGGTLFAVDDAGRVAQVAMATGAVTATFDPRAGRPIALMRVAAA